MGPKFKIPESESEKIIETPKIRESLFATNQNESDIYEPDKKPQATADPKQVFELIFSSKLDAFISINKNRGEVIARSLKVFQKVLINLIKKPDQAKYRLLKGGNKTLSANIFEFKNLVDILLMVGFEKISKGEFESRFPKMDLEPSLHNLYLCRTKVDLEKLGVLFDMIDKINENIQNFKNKILEQRNKFAFGYRGSPKEIKGDSKRSI